MKGSVSKRCPCPVRKDTKGRKIACKKPHGTWTYVVNISYNPDTGKRQQKRQSGFATREEAEQALADYLAGYTHGQPIYDKRMTVADYLRTWIDQKQHTGTRATTLASYRQHVTDYLIPHLGHIRLQDLNTATIEAMQRDLAQPRAAIPADQPVRRGQKRNPGTLSIATRQRIHATLRSALASARKKGLIKNNPAELVEMPQARRNRVRPWEADELGAFLDHASNDRYGPLFEVAAMTGLRRGELAGLRWDDVNLGNGVIVVRQQLVEITGGGTCAYCGQHHNQFVFSRPKTESGEDRQVDLAESTVGVLLAHRLAQDGERTEWGELYQDHGLVFARGNGDPVPPGHLTERFQALTDRAGLRRIRFHDLRHGQASLMLAAGVPLAVVSKRLGHSSVQITSDTYSHLLAGVGSAAANAAASLVPRSGAEGSRQNLCDHPVTSSGDLGAS